MKMRVEYLNKYSQLHAKKAKTFDEAKFAAWDISPEDLETVSEEKLREDKELAMKLILSKVIFSS